MRINRNVELVTRFAGDLAINCVLFPFVLLGGRPSFSLTEAQWEREQEERNKQFTEKVKDYVLQLEEYKYLNLDFVEYYAVDMRRNCGENKIRFKGETKTGQNLVLEIEVKDFVNYYLQLNNNI